MKPEQPQEPDLARHVEAFFAKHLMRDRNDSPHTVAAYRDAFRLLLAFAKRQTRREPASLAVADLDAPFVAAFLDYLEHERGNTVRTRNGRLSAIHSFFRYVALQEPRHGALAQRVLAVPSKKGDRRTIEYLTEAEAEAILAAPDLEKWAGRRDRALFLLAIQAGLRVSELTRLRLADVVLGPGAHVRCQGKGRKERRTPLRAGTTRVLRAWLRERGGSPDDPLFPSARGHHLSRDGVAYLLARHVSTAAASCPSLSRKRVTPHVLRHTTAMTLLQHGVDRSVIALWLGHESMQTTEIYLHADLKLKQRALDRTTSPRLKRVRYRPSDRLLAFLEAL